MLRPQRQSFSHVVEPDGLSFSLPLPQQDPGLVEAVCVLEPARREMGGRPSVTGPHGGGGAQKGQGRGSENKFTYFCLLRAGLNF